MLSFNNWPFKIAILANSYKLVSYSATYWPVMVTNERNMTYMIYIYLDILTKVCCWAFQCAHLHSIETLTQPTKKHSCNLIWNLLSPIIVIYKVTDSSCNLKSVSFIHFSVFDKTTFSPDRLIQAGACTQHCVILLRSEAALWGKWKCQNYLGFISEVW